VSPVTSTKQVLELIQEVKTGAASYCTNFYSSPQKIVNWVEHGELFAGRYGNAVLLLRKNAGFSHLYFGATSPDALAQGIHSWPQRNQEAIVVDLIGREPDVAGSLGIWEGNGFKRYQSLNRMTRTAQLPAEARVVADPRIGFADRPDCGPIQDLLRSAFDPYAEQLPTRYELEAAIGARQILVARHEGALAGVLFFETQGVTSTLRYWLVAEPFRSLGVGSGLMKEYFNSHPRVCRYVLWVIAQNQPAIQKYAHYGFAPDGLVDYVLAKGNMFHDSVN